MNILAILKVTTTPTLMNVKCSLLLVKLKIVLSALKLEVIIQNMVTILIKDVCNAQKVLGKKKVSVLMKENLQKDGSNGVVMNKPITDVISVELNISGWTIVLLLVLMPLLYVKVTSCQFKLVFGAEIMKAP